MLRNNEDSSIKSRKDWSDLFCIPKVFYIPLIATILLFLAANVSIAAEEAERILSLVDYIGGDYRNAVHDGKVVNHNEYNEMIGFSNDAILLFERLNPSNLEKSKIWSDLELLNRKILNKSPVNEIEALSNEIKDKLISDYGIVPYPQNHPSLNAGRELYVKNCSQCHGILGYGDGALASDLSPPPVNLTDIDSTAGLSPFKIYNTLSFGIEGTEMPKFPNLSDKEKWDLAFYVMTLGINDVDSTSGSRSVMDKLPDELKDYKILSTLTNDDIRGILETNNIEKVDKQRVISYLRLGTIEDSSLKDNSLLNTRTILANSLQLYKQGRKEEAYNEALDAYLEGFEKVEPSLALKDRDLTYKIETRFSEYREAIKHGRSIERVGNLYQEITNELSRASLILENSKPVGKLLSFTNSLAIILREGLEAVLIIAAVLAFLSATGSRNAIKYVHLGWILALVAGLITWALAKTIITISGAQREIIEGVTSLVAAAVLFYVSYWLITKIEVKKWKEYIQGKVQKAISKKSVFALASVSFFAMYREAFETVLFYQALWYQAEDSKDAILWGFILGVLILIILVFAIFKLALRIPLKYFFSVTSFFLYFLCFILLGKGIREFQEAGIVGIRSLDFIPQVDLLGIYPTVETSIPQGLLILALLGALIWVGYVKKEKERKEIVISLSRISEDMKLMQESFEHIKNHIIEWKRCEDIDMEAEELDSQIQGVISHVDNLEDKLLDFYDIVSKNRETARKTH
ncbi:MAG: cytochrome c/FTR1 family iron permease [Deltaproteobacteria bacterium]|nr:cytochrome c/FTR1 family iron permease [Deltaproteobacteria bacterium]